MFGKVFKKSEDNNSMVKYYWRATEAVSRPLAILFTLVILFICVALVFSLFLGGRWLYRQAFNSNDSTTTQVETINNGQSTTVEVELPSSTPSVTVTDGTTPAQTTPANNGNIPNTGPEPE